MKNITISNIFDVLSRKMISSFLTKESVFRNFVLFSSICFLFFSSQTYGQFANVNPPTGGFAIDGGLRANTPISPIPFASNQGDWYPGTLAGATGGSVFDNLGAVIAQATTQTSGRSYGENFNGKDNVFTNGSKFNDFVSSLRWFENSAPDKNDINNALYHVSRDGGNNQWIFISGDRLSTNGTSYIDFELLQGSIVQNANGTFTGTPVATKPNGGGRTENDVIISMEYTNGGSKPNVFIYQWKGSGNNWSYQQVPSSAALLANAFAETNRTGSETNLPYSAFGSTTYQQFAFVEAAVNVTYLTNILGGTSCSNLNIKTLWVKTKASASSTAALKDFITPIPVDLVFGSTDIDPIAAKCASDNTAYLLSATPPGGVFSGPGLSHTGGSYYFTPSNAGGAGTKTITYVTTDGSCTTTEPIMVNTLPTATASNNGPVCADTTTITLNETGGDAVSWSWVSDGSATITNPTDQSPMATGFINGEKFTVTVTNTNGCTSTANTTITVKANPGTPSVSYTAPTCDQDTFSITVFSVTNGASYTVKDKNGNPITGISPSVPYQAPNTTNIVFSNIPAGRGYQVSVSVGDCNSAANSCPPAAKLVSSALKAKEVIAPIAAKIETAGFDAYPVPFKDLLTVKYNFDYASDVKIEVFNAQGISILSKIDTNVYLNKEITLDLRMNKGKEQVYVVKVTTNRGSSVKKVISSR
ncbi:T9SS type A sorting domain-containing protein [Flavobacterium sp. LB3P122]|uniref:T9SS type A sorting domain-containing protein n=1 Tax=Flavobacterium algoriphilum TaxID=3398738 RepID=UPI003A853E19